MATLVTTPIKTFVSGETVTPTKLNELSQSTVALTAGTIVDADVSASAAIALSKLATGALPTAITTTTANIVDASVTPAKLSQPYTLGTAKASTSGTSIDFSPADGTGIPPWAKRITVMFNRISTNGSSRILVILGSGSFSGGVFESVTSEVGTTVFATETSTAGLIIRNFSGANFLAGTMTICLVTGNSFLATHNLYNVGGSGAISGAGGCTLTGALDRIRVTTVNGIDTFDAGSINIAYEG